MSRVPDPDAFVAALEAALATVTAEENFHRARLDELEIERKGLQLALKRYKVETITVGSWSSSTMIVPVGDVDVATTAEEQAAERAGELAELEVEEAEENPDSENPQPATATMTDVMTEILRQTRQPLGPKDFLPLLEGMGLPQEGTATIRATLGHLNRKGQLRQIRRGAWVLRGSEAERVHAGDDIFSDVETPETAEAPAVATARASGPVPSQQEGDRFGAVMAS